MMTALVSLLLEMRVSEQTISFTNPKNNKTTFSNAKALKIVYPKAFEVTAGQDDRRG